MMQVLKHYIKIIIGRPDPSWPLFLFEQGVHSDTWKNRASVLDWAERCLAEKDTRESPERYEESDDPIVRQGYELKKKAEANFKDISKKYSDIRILIHVPNPMCSPAGYSLFMNFAEAFAFIGIPTETLAWDDSTERVLNEFKPTVLLSSDSSDWLAKIDWDAIANYRQQHALRIGLTASLAEYGNTPLPERLQWAKEHDIDFFYSYRDSDYVHTRKEYQPFFDAGYKILFLPFGANILHYYPVPDINRDTNYTFLGSVNGTKLPRYIDFMLPVVSKYPGIFDGPGWLHIKDFHFNRDRDRYVYARSKVGLNLHLQEQIDWACEVNERTFQLATCGIPQVVDNAKLLPKLFSKEALFIAKNPDEYLKYFESILKQPELGIERALIAQREVFEKHTTFHRAESFIQQLQVTIT